jgi:hypothetical protein
MFWCTNLVKSKRTISSPKHPVHFQCPPCLQINVNQSFFSGSKVARADTLTTHICLEPSLKIIVAKPTLNLEIVGQLYFTLTSYLCTYLSTGHISGLIKEPFYTSLTAYMHTTWHLFHLRWSNYINIMNSSNNKPRKSRKKCFATWGSPSQTLACEIF